MVSNFTARRSIPWLAIAALSAAFLAGAWLLTASGTDLTDWRSWQEKCEAAGRFIVEFDGRTVCSAELALMP